MLPPFSFYLTNRTPTFCFWQAPLNACTGPFSKFSASRLSKAYDDVENFENGFTAHYLNLISESDSSIPKITEGSKSRKVELEQEWAKYKRDAENLLKGPVQAFNEACQEQNVGVLFVK